MDENNYNPRFDLIKYGPISPVNFSELFCCLRQIHGFTKNQMSKIVNYSHHTISVNEKSTQNPTIKTLLKYLLPLELEMVINSNGITIRDPKSNFIIVKNWKVKFD